MESYNVVIPSSFDFDQLLQRDPIKFKDVNEEIVVGILGLVSKYVSYEFDKSKKKDLMYLKPKAYLSSRRLKHLFGDGYKLALEFLHRDVLFKYPYSEFKTFSFNYNPKISNDGFTIRTICGKTTKTKSIVRKLNSIGKTVKSSTKKRFEFLLKFLDSDRLKIDLESAQIEINQHFELNKSWRGSLMLLQKVTDISNGSYNVTCNPETDGRLHSNFARLNKEMRKHLTYDGKPLVEIDISNSIPFILSTLLNGSILLGKVYSYDRTIYNKYTCKFLKYLPDVDIKEIEAFHNLSASGTLYEKLLDESYFKKTIDMSYTHTDENGHDCYSYDLARKKVKKDLLSMMFARNKDYKPTQKIFSNAFPTIAQFIKAFKRKYYSRFSHFLFQTESLIMLEGIARAFNAKYRGRIPLLTIHDCIVTTSDNIELLHEFMISEFQIIFQNEKPNLKIKPWQDNILPTQN